MAAPSAAEYYGAERDYAHAHAQPHAGADRRWKELDSQAAQLGVDNGDQVIALEDCAIPGCRGRKARKLMNTPEGETRNFTFRKSDGSIVDVRLTAVPWE